MSSAYIILTTSMDFACAARPGMQHTLETLDGLAIKRVPKL